MYRELLNYLATKHQSDVNPTSGTFAFDLTCEVKNYAFSRYFAFVGISAKKQKQPVLARAFLSFQRQLPIKRVLKLNECTVHTFKKIPGHLGLLQCLSTNVDSVLTMSWNGNFKTKTRKISEKTNRFAKLFKALNQGSR